MNKGNLANLEQANNVQEILNLSLLKMFNHIQEFCLGRRFKQYSQKSTNLV